jgi:uncharacterized protein
MRDAGNVGNKRPYDMDKMLQALEQEGSEFTVFGGEPLLVPLEDLERIWAWGYQRFKKNGTQTNGVLITPAHVEAFKKYNVHVGFSLDGPDELNDSRWAGTIERTREATVKSHANLKACVEAGVGTSVIITLYKGNASAEHLPRLKTWIQELDAMGSRGVRIHLLEIDHPLVRKKMQLSTAETISALDELVVLERTLPHVRLDILTDMRKLLDADDEDVTCIWNPCDPYTTDAVRGIDGQGNRSNCGRTNKDGIPRLKAERHGYERQVILHATPHKDGGCQGCRFFLACKGQCPGTAIDGDWRNRSEQCPIWFALFEKLEAEFVAAGKTPLSLSADRPALEVAMVGAWAQGEFVTIKASRQRLQEGGVAPVRGGSHADVPHGDQHGDHWDGPQQKEKA